MSHPRTIDHIMHASRMAAFVSSVGFNSITPDQVLAQAKTIGVSDTVMAYMDQAMNAWNVMFHDEHASAMRGATIVIDPWGHSVYDDE